MTHFNPRSHERSDNKEGITCKELAISIHAPTRGATVFLIALFTIGGNFNPRSHERSDDARLLSGTPHFYFNPRSHERSDTTGEGDFS